MDGWLWGGAYNARRKLSEYEIETMVTKLEREDIINAVKPEEHGRSAMLPPTPEQENEVLAGVPESMKKPYRLRRPDIVAMLAPCATPPEVRTLCPLPAECSEQKLTPLGLGLCAAGPGGSDPGRAYGPCGGLPAGVAPAHACRSERRGRRGVAR